MYQINSDGIDALQGWVVAVYVQQKQVEKDRLGQNKGFLLSEICSSIDIKLVVYK